MCPQLQLNETGVTVDPKGPDFEESNMMHAFNGYIYCNNYCMPVCKGVGLLTLVCEYSFGSEESLHSMVYEGMVST
jgi:hypothetical protein